MPSPYTADISWIDAAEMSRRLGVRYDEISIKPMFESFKQSLAGEFPAMAPYRRSISGAVNADYARLDATVRDGDEVAFLPPVSGG